MIEVVLSVSFLLGFCENCILLLRLKEKRIIDYCIKALKSILYMLGDFSYHYFVMPIMLGTSSYMDIQTLIL